MKRICLMLGLAIFTFTNQAQAQLGKSFVYVGYGLGSLDRLGIDIKNFTINASVPGLKEAADFTNKGSNVISAGIETKLFPKLSIGLMVNYQYVSSEVNFNTVTAGITTVQKQNYKINSLAVMPRINYRWLDKLGVTIYSGISGGPSFNYYKGINKDNVKDKSSVTLPSIQIHALGIRFGRKYSVFAEAGFGALGIVNGGISRRF
jgi:hypothetical protein